MSGQSRRPGENRGPRGRETVKGHSGTPHSWSVSLAMVAAFLLAGAGMTFGPRLLLWVGVAVFVVLGAYSLTAHTWTDRRTRHDEYHEHHHDHE